MVWNPSQSSQIEKLDKLQRRFVLMFVDKMDFLNMYLSDITTRFALVPLAFYHKYNDIVFIHTLINIAIGYFEFLSIICFKVLAFNSKNVLLAFYIPSQYT